MSTHTIGFYEDLTKIIFQLSSNMHLISSSDSHAKIKGRPGQNSFSVFLAMSIFFPSMTSF